MSDFWSEVLYEASYYGQPLDILLTRDDVSRSLAMHEFPRIDGADVEDMGGKVRTTQARILFFERPGTGDDGMDHINRFELFHNLVQQGEPGEFVHPITGSYPALVGDFSFEADAEQRDQIVVDCTFVESRLRRPEFQNMEAINLLDAAAMVEVTAKQMDAQLEELDLEDTTPGDALSMVEGWAEEGVTVREVEQQMASMSDQIATAIDDLELATDVSNYVLYRNYQRLHYQMRRAAEAFQRESDTISQITVLVAKPLRVVLVDYYGAREAAAREAEVIRLNDIRDPSIIPAGKTLIIQTPAKAGKAALRGTRGAGSLRRTPG